MKLLLCVAAILVASTSMTGVTYAELITIEDPEALLRLILEDKIEIVGTAAFDHLRGSFAKKSLVVASISSCVADDGAHSLSAG